MVVAVTPCAVEPPLLSPFFHGFTHNGAVYDCILTRLVVGAHRGLASASGVPIPGSFFASVPVACAAAAGSAADVAVASASTVVPTASRARSLIASPPS